MLQLRKPLRLADRSSEQEIQISCVRSFDLLGARRAEWNALVERSQNATVFQTFEWHASWWRTFGDDFVAGAGVALAETEDGSDETVTLRAAQALDETYVPFFGVRHRLR